VISKIRNRVASEQGFTLIELLVVIVILGLLVAIAVPSYLSFRGKAETASAQANVRSAIPAAESYYQDTSANGGNGSYANISGDLLRTQAPGVAPTVLAVPVNTNKGYCIEDTINGSSYDYVGGDPTGALQQGKAAATIQVGDCTAAVGAAGQ
jgi:type IV pilus assembly protein PilA